MDEWEDGRGFTTRGGQKSLITLSWHQCTKKKKRKKEAIQRFITCNYFKPPPSSLYTQIGEEWIINGKIYFIE